MKHIFGKSNHQLANFITFTRILGVGLIFYFTPFTTNLVALWVAVIYTLICITDFLDGWIARRFNMITDVGKILDPLADKILVLVFLPLLSMQVISAFPVFIILAREFSIMALRVVSAKNGVIVPAKLSGKIKTSVTLPLCGILLGRVPVDHVSIPSYLLPVEWLRLWIATWPNWFIHGFIWITVIITLWSFLDYFKDFMWEQALKKSNGDTQKAKSQLYTIIPNSITFLNLAFGLAAIVISFTDKMNVAVLLILAGIFMDGFDGRMARKLGVFSPLGAKLDSNADSVTFGIAPAFIIANSFRFSFPGIGLPLGIVLALAYFVSVYYRLKRFDKSGHGLFFQGMPSPVGACMAVLVYVTAFQNSLVVTLVWTLAMAFLMASTIPYAHVDYAIRETPLKILKHPGLIALGGTILQLAHVPFIKHLPMAELTIVLASFYMVSPLFIREKNPS